MKLNFDEYNFNKKIQKIIDKRENGIKSKYTDEYIKNKIKTYYEVLKIEYEGDVFFDEGLYEQFYKEYENKQDINIYKYYLYRKILDCF